MKYDIRAVNNNICNIFINISIIYENIHYKMVNKLFIASKTILVNNKNNY